MAGDPTPRMYGRVTLDLTKHFELFGTIMIIITSLTGFGIGWGRPVPMDPSKMRNPRWDHFWAVLAGPLSNLLQAFVFAIIFRVLHLVAPDALGNPYIAALLLFGVLTNLGLFFFNLLPLGPLDGMWIVGTFLNERTRYAWTKWNLTTGQFVFLALILFGQLSSVSLLSAIIVPPLRVMAKFLLGDSPI